MSAELYLRLPCICLLPRAGEFPCHEDRTAGARVHLQDLSASCLLPSSWSLLFSSAQWGWFVLIWNFLGKAITNLVPLAGLCMVACFFW